MDSESKTPDVRNDYEMNLLDMNNIESNKSSEMQSDSVNDLKNINSPSNWCESSITTKDTSLAGQSDNVMSETMQNEQTHKSMKLPLQNNYQGIETDTDECDKTNKMIEEVLFTTVTSADASEATTSQDNTPSSSYAKEPNTLHTDQNKVKRGTSMETLGDNLDEDSSKRQKLSDSVHDEENLNDDAVTFQKTNSKMRQRNYRKRIVSDNEDSSRTTVHHETVREASIIDADEGFLSSNIFHNRRLSLKRFLVMS